MPISSFRPTKPDHPFKVASSPVGPMLGEGRHSETPVWGRTVSCKPPSSFFKHSILTIPSV